MGRKTKKKPWNFIKTQFHGFFLFSSHRHIILPESYTLILKTCGSCRTFFFSRNQTCRISYALPHNGIEPSHFSLKRLPPYLCTGSGYNCKSLYLYCRTYRCRVSLIKPMSVCRDWANNPLSGSYIWNTLRRC